MNKEKKDLILGVGLVIFGIIWLPNSLTRVTSYGTYKGITTSLGAIVIGSLLVFVELSKKKKSNNK